MIKTLDNIEAEGPWNPGFDSAFTKDLFAATTIFLQGNSLRSFSNAYELHAVSGIPLEELAVLSPLRLLLHEIIVRVTADFEICDPENANILSLGVNLRSMVDRLRIKLLSDASKEIEALYEELREKVVRTVEHEISQLFAGPKQSEKAKPANNAWGWFGRKHSTPSSISAPVETTWQRDERVIKLWSELLISNPDDIASTSIRSLVKAATSVRTKSGRILGERSFLPQIAVGLAMNEVGGRAIGRLVEPRLSEAARQFKFRPLPAQTRTVGMVTKGAPASGKSTMRPLQRRLAIRMGLDWGDFALISPDTWRRALLDFSSLGENYKYAGMFTSHEVALIDKKLDAHLVAKGGRQKSTHILVDRFRFDSFALDSEECLHLPSRFQDILLYIFMITPPEHSVERAWQRGLEIGRYKALDDLLAHNVEAFTGMRDILLGRGLLRKSKVHFELLDNDVNRGEIPITAAFGWSGELNILDPRILIDVESFRKVDISARKRDRLYASSAASSVEQNSAFLRSCLLKFPRVNLVEPKTGIIYALIEDRRFKWRDANASERMFVQLDIVERSAPELDLSKAQCNNFSRCLECEFDYTIGRRY